MGRWWWWLVLLPVFIVVEGSVHNWVQNWLDRREDKSFQDPNIESIDMEHKASLLPSIVGLAAALRCVIIVGMIFISIDN
jgi:hypothetical protein